MTEFIFPMLGIDYGVKRVGLALAETVLAEPWLVLPNDDTFWQHLLQILLDKDIKYIVVGISEGQMAAQTQEFIQELKSRTTIPIQTWDETLTTHEARRKLAVRGQSGPRRQEVDHFAAAEMLQDYLDT